MQYAVEIRPVTPELHVGRPYEMVCEVRPTPERPVRFTWFHNDQVVSDDARLVLSSLAYPDIGSYICRAEWTPDNARTGIMAANATVELTLALTRTTEIEEDISVGGYHPDEVRPTIFLTPGSPGQLEWSEGDDLYSRCSVQNGEQYYIKWIRRLPDRTVQELSQNALLFLPKVRASELQHPIYCQVTRDSDGAVFEELLNVRVAEYQDYTGSTELQLTIRSLPAEDLSQGRVMRQCLFEGDPTLNDQFDFRWLDQSGRVVNNGDALILLVRSTGLAQLVAMPVCACSISVYNVVITPSIIRVRINQPIELECYVTEEGWRPAPVMPRFRLRDPRIHYDTQPVGENRARFSIPGGLDSDFNGTQVECYTDLENLVDLGNYTCEATNRQTGTIYQARYHVTRASRSQDMQYAVEIRPVTPELHVGRPYEMVCEVRPTPERPVRFTWFHNDQVVSDDARLVLSSLAYPDIGSYICRAEWTPDNARTGIMAANATVELTLALTRTTEIEMSPPPGSILVTLPGEMRELHCEFTSRGPPDVRWFFDGQPLEFHPTLNASGTVHRMDALRVSIVTLRSVEVSQGGTYECRIGNEIKQTHVIVRAEKGLEVNPETETVDEGMAVEFHCRAHGANQMVNREMEWFFRPFHGGSMVPLALGNLGGFVRQDDDYASHTSFVSKARARKQDEGEYICRLPSQNLQAVGRLYEFSDNELFTNKLLLPLTLNLIRKEMSPPPGSILVTLPGEMRELHCEFTSRGPPDVRWFFDGQPLEFHPTLNASGTVHRMDALRVSIVTLRSVEVSQGGTYECRIGNEIKQTHVIVRAEKGLEVNPETETVDEGMAVEFHCRAHGANQMVNREMEWFFRPFHGGSMVPLALGNLGGFVRQDDDYASHTSFVSKARARKQDEGEYICRLPSQNLQAVGRLYVHPTVARCDGTMFNCGSGNRRIPLAYVCDKDQDCPYGEDERNCAVPTIQTSDVYRYPVRQGGQVVLTCRVFGLPVPRVIWRFNWGCLPDEGGRFRVTSTVQNCDSPTPVVLSTLTIQNVRPGDDGIYNCEALAGAHRAMSNDYFVMLES
ncbi:hypothetical protein AHF37_06335 [Paragonimus kellicotti]|nr:hypothetical protein AHF37_06335 [Paragonimus kellicotti]